MHQYEVHISEVVEHIVIVQCDSEEAATKEATNLIENGFYGDDFLTLHTQKYSDTKVDKVS